jgi:hypothetical protein
MSAAKKSTPAHAHPVVLMARAIGIVLGVVLLMAHTPALWPVVGGLAAYALTLGALRSSWPAESRQAGPDART